MKDEKTIIHEIALEAMKSLIIARAKGFLSMSDCSDIAASAYDLAEEMIKQGKHVEKMIDEGEIFGE